MNEQDVGANIRRLRKQQGHTLTALADCAGLAKSSLSKIETGQVSAPISTLMSIADALNTPLAQFFTERHEPPAFVFTSKGQGQPITRDGTKFGYSYQGLALDMPAKSAEPFLLTIRPGDPVGSFSHNGEEFIYMLSGKIEFTIGDTPIIMSTGDSLYFNPSQVHQTKVLGKRDATFLCIFIQQQQASGGNV